MPLSFKKLLKNWLYTLSKNIKLSKDIKKSFWKTIFGLKDYRNRKKARLDNSLASKKN